LFDKANKIMPFLVSAILFFIVAFIITKYFGNSAIDIQMHDTYFVIALTYIPLTCGILMMFFASLYFMINYFFKKPLNKNLSIVHFFLTWIPILALLWLPMKLVNHSYSSSPIFSTYDPLNMTAFTYFMIFILGLVIFLFNFFRSFYLSLYSK